MRVRLTEGQLRQRILLELRDDRSASSSGQRSVDKIVSAYGSITDEDVAAMEELGIFKLARSPGRMLADVNFDDKALGFLDYMSEVKPLIAVFRTGNFIPVDELESQLSALTRRPDSDESLSDAAAALPDLIKHVRRVYAVMLAKSEAEPDDPLGRIAFANNRKGMPHEPDTHLEGRLRAALINHFEGSALLNKEHAQLLQDFMAQGLYPRMFAEPTTPVLVRGMSGESGSVKWLTRLIGRKPEKRGSAEVNFTFVPKRGASSWTSSKAVAKGFHILGSEVDIILHASVADNPGQFLSAKPGLYSTDFISGRFESEKESLGLGPIRVSKIEWVLNDE